MRSVSGGRAVACLLAGLAGPSAAAPASAACQLARYIELPVQMRGLRPIVTAQFGGRDAQMILDSGAVFSMLSRASAQQYGLRLEMPPGNLRIRGLNGDTSAVIAQVEDFGLGEIRLPRVTFIVGGTDVGFAGLLGQNILSIDDTEYDLPHGAVRLMKATDCKDSQVAYWAGSRPLSGLPIEPRGPGQNHTIGTVLVNGVKIRAVFDTGAPTSILTMAGAKKAGMTPDSEGVHKAGFTTGVGRDAKATWIATFAKIDIGGEQIPHPKIAFGDVSLGEGEMLIGADFFLTHRVYVSNKTNRMYLTYEGGPLFGITPTGAVAADGTKIDLKDGASAPADAEGYARRGGVSFSNRKPDDAIADFDKAIELAPKDARYLTMRAGARLAKGQLLLAAGDLDKAVTLDPKSADARMMRAAMRLGAHDPQGASEDIKALDTLLPPTAAQRLILAQMADAADLPEMALADFSAWIDSHKEDAGRPSALNGRCWLRGRLNRELDAALTDCNEALHLRPGTSAILDSRALVRFRKGDFAAALTDYDAAIKADPKAGWSLYARGLTKAKLGDAAGAKADREAALAINPGLPERSRKYGLES
jgi:tetratricopeptide (TPR) repeat protein/predicted aspartyl protease